jgi:hypothetical protein
MSKKLKREHYVNNKEFYSLLVEYRSIIDEINTIKETKTSTLLDLESLNATKESINLIMDKYDKKIHLIQESQKMRVVKNKLGSIFIKIANGLLNKPNFINYSSDRKQDMASDAVYFMLKCTDRYDVSRENPFAYYTTIAKNAFVQFINSKNKISDKVTSFSYIENMHLENNVIDEDWE